jgi:N-acetylneuraminic acid mutarotase
MWKKVVVDGFVPKGRSSSALTHVNGKLYLFGGEGVPRIPVDGDLFTFDLKDHKWSVIDTIGKRPSKRLAHTMTSIGKFLYLYGGRVQNEDDDLSDLFQYDIEKNTWCPVDTTGESPKSRSYHSATALNGNLYLFGGCQHSKEGTKRMNDLHVLNLKSLEWKKIEPKNDSPCVRGGTTLTSSGNKIYIHAGFGGKELDDFYSFDLETLYWTKIDATGDLPGARSVHTLLALEDHLFLFGGEKEPSQKGHEGAGLYWGDTYVFDLKKTAWHQIQGERPSNRGWIQACVVDKDTVAMFGGFTGDERVNDLWIFTKQ